MLIRFLEDATLLMRFLRVSRNNCASARPGGTHGASGVTFVSTEPSVGTYDESTDKWTFPELAIGGTEALVITAGFDPLCDEGARYAEKLVAAGVKTTYAPYHGMIHGFLSMGGWLDVSRQALDYASNQLAVALRSI